MSHNFPPHNAGAEYFFGIYIRSTSALKKNQGCPYVAKIKKPLQKHGAHKNAADLQSLKGIISYLQRALQI